MGTNVLGERLTKKEKEKIMSLTATRIRVCLRRGPKRGAGRRDGSHLVAIANQQNHDDNDDMMFWGQFSIWDTFVNI